MFNTENRFGLFARVVLMLALTFTQVVWAQSPAPQTPAKQDVTIVIQQQQVRFAALRVVEQLHLQVTDQAGEVVFDSGAVGVQEINWLLQYPNGAPLKSGLYAYTLTVKEADKDTQVRRGHFIVDRAQDQDGQDKLWITGQRADGIGTEVTVARDQNGTVAGANTGNRKANAANADEIPEGQVVKTLNGLTDNVTLEAGTNIAITPEGNTLKIDAQLGDGQAVKGLNGLTDQVTLEAGPNITITPNGNTLTIAATGAANSSIAEVNGNIGIGTATPAVGLHVGAGVPGGQARLQLDNANGRFGGLNRWTNRLELMSSDAIGLSAGNIAQPHFWLNSSGNIGIGTGSPLAKLHVNGGGIRYENAGKVLSFQTGTEVDMLSPTNSVVIQSLGPAGRNHVILNPFPADGNPYRNGNVGIGTFAPETKLHVQGNGFVETTIRSGNERAILTLDSNPGGQRRVWTLESGVFGTPGLFGIYDRTAGRARLTIDTTGLVSVRALQITGGADFAEHFDINTAPNGSEAPKVEAGMVVSIDPDSPGKLVLSTQAYDYQVAGIISGAGGVNPGMMMSQSGTLADGQHPVALSGRVYCWADASNGPIKPGDLLTTSHTPGHAMRVTDREKAQGAVIGKAMTGLKEGKGLVLVLVTLQ